MRFRTTYLTALVLLLLLGYVFFIELPQEKEQEIVESEAKQVFVLDADNIRTIRLAYPDHEIVLEKSDTGNWQITDPVETRSDPRAINSLISTITDMKLKRVIEEFNKDAGEFGFDPPSLKISLILDDMEEEVIVGDEGAMNNTLYIKQGSTQRVVLVDAWIKGSLTKSLFDLRDKKLFSIERDALSELILTFPAQTIHLKKKDQEWWIEDDRSQRADPDIIESLITNLYTLRATRFIDDKKEIEKIRTAASKETLNVTVIGNDRQPPVSFYQRLGESEAYASISDNPPLYEIPKSAVEEFKMDSFYYQDKTLLSFDESSLKKVIITSLNDRYTLQRENDQWVISGDPSEIDQEEVDQFFLRLKKIKAEKKPGDNIDLESAGLDSPSTSVTLFDQTHEVTGSIKIGKETSGMIYALGNADLGIMLIDKNILDDIPRKNELIKPQETRDPS